MDYTKMLRVVEVITLYGRSFAMVQRPPVVQGLLILEASRLHLDIHIHTHIHTHTHTTR